MIARIQERSKHSCDNERVYVALHGDDDDDSIFSDTSKKM